MTQYIHHGSMPKVGLQSRNLTAFIDDVRTTMDTFMLPKLDAAMTYQTIAAAENIATEISINETKIAELSAVDDNLLTSSQALAPRGQRDLWQNVASFDGWRIEYFESINRVYVSSFNDLRYSDDGGLTWNLVVFDVVILQILIPVIGYNGTDTFVVISPYNSVTEIFTSSDGINFTHVMSIPKSTAHASIKWFNNMFVLNTMYDDTHLIATSPDGVTWTPRLTPTTGTLNTPDQGLGISNNQIVYVSDEYIGGLRSLDGISWENTIGITTGLSCVAYSPDQKIWLGLARSGQGFTSDDAITWTDRGIIAPMAISRVLWVGNNINMWCLETNASNSKYTMYVTFDPRRTAFVNAELDGATLTGGKGYHEAIVYIPQYDRFLIGHPYGIAYSTARIRDIKASSDNIRVRNSPVRTDKYSATSDFTIALTSTETAIVPSTSIGSLTYDAPPVASKIKVSLTMLNSSPAGDNLTLRFKVYGVTLGTPTNTTLLSYTMPVAGGASNLVTRVNASFIIFNTTVQCYVITRQSGINSSSAYTVSLNNITGLQNILNITGQWGTSLSTCVITQYNVSTEFIP